MSGDVQPRKRKEKRRKKEDSEEIPSSFSGDEQLHVHKDASTGGNICAKILFFLLSFVLLVMIGLVVFEYRGSTDDETLVPVSKWASTFDGWLETPVKHGEHADVTESGEQEHGESEEHENESAEGEEHLSEEAASKEEEEDDDEEDDDEEEAKESEEEETKSAEEDEDDEEADKLEDEESEEVDENEIDDRDEDEEEEEEEEEEGSAEDVYERGKSEEDVEADDDDDGEEEDEEEDVEAGREKLDDDDDDDEEEREISAYQRESDEIDDLLSEIPGITESDEDEEGDNLGRSDEIIDKRQKIPGIHEKTVKAVSEEEIEVPRQKQEKEVPDTAQPTEGTSTVTAGQKPHEQHKSQEHGQAKLNPHQSAVKQKDVTEKPIVAKDEKHEALHPQEQLASKSKHQTRFTEEHATKNDGFPSGPGETGQGQKVDDVTASKVTPSKNQKVGAETTKDGPSKVTLPKKQEDDTGSTLKSASMPAGPSKPVVSGGKNFKDKDVSSNEVHSPPKASRIGDKIEHSPKEGKSGISHKVTEQSSPTKLDANNRISISESPHVDKSTEEHKKTVESKDKRGSKSEPSASTSGVKNSKFDTKDSQTTTDDTVKVSDLKTNAHGKLGAAGNSASFDKKVEAGSTGKKKESVVVEPSVKESRNLNSQTKVSHSTVEKKLMENKVENLHKNKGHPSNQGKENDEQFAPKLDHHVDTVNRAAAKKSTAAKVHEDPRKSKVDIEKQKDGFPTSAKVSGDRSSEVHLKVSADKTRQANADNVKNRTPEKSSDVNAARKKNSNENTPPADTHYSKSKDTKASTIPETASKHSVKKESDISKTQGVKPNVQSVSSRKISQAEEGRPMSTSEDHAGHKENTGNNKPVNPNIKKPDLKVSSKQTENEVTQPEKERPSKRKAVPSRRDSDSETVK